jgi:hypothetical protein
MPTHSQKNLHTLQHLPLQPRPAHILAQKTAVRSLEVERLERLPDSVDLRGRQGDHVGVGPHKSVGGGEWVFGREGGVVETRLHVREKKQSQQGLNSLRREKNVEEGGGVESLQAHS